MAVLDKDLTVPAKSLNESSDGESDVPDDNFGSDEDSDELDDAIEGSSDDDKEEVNSNSEGDIEGTDTLVNATDESGDDSEIEGTDTLVNATDEVGDDSDVSEGNNEVNSSDDGNEASEEEEEEGNVGWADAMSKVLAIGKNSDKTVSVLSKAKKDNVKQKKTKQKKENGEDEESEEEEKVLEPLAVRKARKKELDSIGRTRPDILQRNAEKVLARVATRGVVQLFNAVREQQKDIKTKLKEAGGSMRKQEKVYKNIDKNSFVDILTGGKTKVSDMTGAPLSKKTKVEDDIKEEEDDKSSSWNILRDDFMLGAKMKDWDKDSDGD